MEIGQPVSWLPFTFLQSWTFIFAADASSWLNSAPDDRTDSSLTRKKSSLTFLELFLGSIFVSVFLRGQNVRSVVWGGSPFVLLAK